jgi:hypothetical protein
MTSTNELTPTTPTAPITGLVPMIHVANVERSAEFYRLLGFEVGNFRSTRMCRTSCFTFTRQI